MWYHESIRGSSALPETVDRPTVKLDRETGPLWNKTHPDNVKLYGPNEANDPFRPPPSSGL
jgi:hypothetical protein